MLMIESFRGYDGAALRYGRLRGEGPAESVLLYVPGLGGSVKGALAFLGALRPLFGEIYGPDLRGFGLNSHVTVPQPVHYLDDLDAFWQEKSLQTHAPVTLCAISLGAVVATHWALAHPGQFSRMMLVSPAFKPHAATFPWHYALQRLAGRLLRGESHQTTMPYTIAKLTRNPELLNAKELMFTPPTVPTDFLLATRPFADAAFQRLSELTLPTLVVVPGDDEVCDPNAMRRGYERIRAPKILHDYGGLKHDALMEPESPQIAADMAAWLQNPELCPPAIVCRP
ncbi:MAG: alpha/beta fold hydrolase [Vampirovibrionales bacterium]|nr:alpha/beta fold hydrolase [Vampirovibrionales bacterium]